MPAERMDWTPVWFAIKEWVAKAAGLELVHVNWSDWPQGFAGDVQVRLTLSAAPPDGPLSVSYEVSEDTLRARQEGSAELQVSISVRSRSQDPSRFAFGYAKAIEGALVDEQLAAVLEKACASPRRLISGPTVFSHPWDNRIEQMVTLEVAFGAMITQEMGAVDYFDHVELSSDVTEVDGELVDATLQLDKEVVGPP